MSSTGCYLSRRPLRWLPLGRRWKCCPSELDTSPAPNNAASGRRRWAFTKMRRTAVGLLAQMPGGRPGELPIADDRAGLGLGIRPRLVAAASASKETRQTHIGLKILIGPSFFA